MPEWRPDTNPRVIFLTFDQIDHSLVGRATHLLVENEAADGQLYNFLLRQMRDLMKVPSLCIETCHGGGAGILPAFALRVNARCMIVALVDSDKKAPNDCFGDVFNAMLNVCQDWALGSVTATPCHEVENLVPLTVAMKLQCATACRLVPLVLHVEEWETHHNSSEKLWHYVDLKKGISREHINTLRTNAKQWLEKRLKDCGVDVDKGSYNGFEDHMITQLFSNGEAQKLLRSAIRGKPWMDHFGDFIGGMIWWFAAYTPVRT